MVDILDEVRQEHAQQQAMQLARRYGPYFIGAIVALLALIGGVEWWQGHQKNKSAEAGLAYFHVYQALAQNPSDEKALKDLQDLAENAPKGYRMVAGFKQAESLVKQSKIDEAIAAYEKLANAAADSDMQSLAALKAAYLKIEHGKLNEKEKLQTLLKDEAQTDKPWHALAMQLQGALALKEGQFKEAAEIFTALSQDAGTPEPIRQLASNWALYAKSKI